MEFEELLRAKEQIVTHYQQRAKLVNKWESQLRSFSNFMLESLPESWVQRIKISAAKESVDSLDGLSNPKVQEAYQQLKIKLGQEIGLSDWVLLDQALINRFAEVTGDNQWIHTDVDRAKNESIYRSTVAHGFLILSLFPALTNFDESTNGIYKNTKMAVNCGLDKVQFLHAVKSGSRIRARTKLRSLTPLKKSIELTNEIFIEVENSKKIACSARLLVRLYY